MIITWEKNYMRRFIDFFSFTIFKNISEQRGIANKKRKEQKEKEVEEFDEDNE